ncbi:MAG: hypothetical protein C0506_07240 [Anaerolinea sp.]|nr:hypothetical protein [Anaerolinea sp.]
MTQAELLVDGKKLKRADDPSYVARGPMSFEEYLQWEYEGGLTEWVDGEVFVYMTASNRHQKILDFLYRLIGNWAELTGAGEVRSAPYPMQARAGGSGREPDIVFVRREHLDRFGDQHLIGPPDLAVEIVSPDSVARDRVTKLREYAQAGIPEYWIVDARAGQNRADFHTLSADGSYVAVDLAEGVFRSTVLEGFWLRPEWLWEPEPKPMAALREIMGGVF